MARKKRIASHQSKVGGQFAGIPHAVMDSPAYADLSLVARALLLELVRRFNGHNNGQIGLDQRTARERLRARPDSIVSGFAELMEHGFIDLSMEGCRVARRAREWTLTWITSGKAPPYSQPSMAYRSWKPGDVTRKKSATTVVAGKAVSVTAVVTEGIDPATVAVAEEGKKWRKSVTRSDPACNHSGSAYKIPCSPAPADQPSQGDGEHDCTVKLAATPARSIARIGGEQSFEHELAMRLARGGPEAEALAAMTEVAQREALEAIRTTLSARRRAA